MKPVAAERGVCANVCCPSTGSSSRLRGTASSPAKWRSLRRSSGWRCRRSERCAAVPQAHRCQYLACRRHCHGRRHGGRNALDRRAAKQLCSPWVELHPRRRARGAERPARSALSLAPPCLQARKVPEKMEDLIEFFLDTGGQRPLGGLVVLHLWPPAFEGLLGTAVVHTRARYPELAYAARGKQGALCACPHVNFATLSPCRGARNGV